MTHGPDLATKISNLLWVIFPSWFGQKQSELRVSCVCFHCTCS